MPVMCGAPKSQNTMTSRERIAWIGFAGSLVALITTVLTKWTPIPPGPKLKPAELFGAGVSAGLALERCGLPTRTDEQLTADRAKAVSSAKEQLQACQDGLRRYGPVREDVLEDVKKVRMELKADPYPIGDLITRVQNSLK